MRDSIGGCVPAGHQRIKVGGAAPAGHVRIVMHVKEVGEVDGEVEEDMEEEDARILSENTEEVS